MHNPLKRPILEILKNTRGGLKEYELHKILGGDAFAQFVNNCSDNVILFRKHFLVMNALYELHVELIEQGLYLYISALDIHLQGISEHNQANQTLSTDTGFAKLSQYYRNWDNFNKADDKNVASLLQAFWKKFLANEEKELALTCLGLESGASWVEIQNQYRHLCQQHHPDKGGDALYFIEIRQAYDNLKCIYD